MSDNPKFIPEEYTQHGWYGNNTTIPRGEKCRIAESDVDLPEQEEARAVYRGQQADHLHYVEQGWIDPNAPADQWMEYENVFPMQTDIILWALPLSEQRILRGNGKLSKNQRNTEIYTSKQQVKQ